MIKSVMITGANAGLGRETARQLGKMSAIERVYLACRNEDKAREAKTLLEEATGRKIFEVVLMDTSDLDSVRSAVEALPAPVDGLLMNAGGMGGKTPNALTSNGVTHLFASNVLGHMVLLDELIKADKLKEVAVFAGSEAARGIPKMGFKRPSLATSSTEEFASIADGTAFDRDIDPMKAYGPVKYLATMTTSSFARKHPGLRILTVSPGGTSGTDAMESLKPMQKFIFKHMSKSVMPLFGLMHDLEIGAERFVKALTDDSLKSGVFYASKAKTVTGPVVDQSTIFSDLANTRYQDNAHRAAMSFAS